MNARNQIIRYVNAILDIIVMLFAYVLANKIKFGWWRTGIRNESNSYMTLFMIFLVTYFFIILVVTTYEDLLGRTFTGEVRAVFKLLAMMAMLTTFFIYITKTNDYYSRGQMAYFLMLSWVFLVIERQSLKRYVTKSFHRSGASEKIMLVTTSDCVASVVKRIKETRNWYFRINCIAVLDCDMVGEEINKIEVRGNIDNFEHIIATEELDSVFLHLPKDFAFPYPRFIDDVQEMGKKVHWNIDEFEQLPGSKRIQFLGKFAVVTWNGTTYRVRYVALKRMMDILVGLCGMALMVLAYPLATIGHALERDNGHVLVSYIRVGKNGRRFYQYRFRTLKNGGELGKLSVTGRILKILGVTNLPMAWNVLLGDMSVVGAVSPSIPRYLNYSKQRRRGLTLRPGILQFWEAYYWKRRNREDFSVEKCEAEYIEHWSLMLDLKVIVRTFLLFISDREYRRYLHTMDKESWAEEKRLLQSLQDAERQLEYYVDGEPEGNEACVGHNAYVGHDAYVENDDHVADKKKSATSRTSPHAHTMYRFIKRIFDIVISLISIVVLSPVLLGLAIAVHWEDGGSILYRQLRIGQHGKKIYIYKFRSMKNNIKDLEKVLTPEQLEQYRKEFKIENDPRVTRIGGFLRRSSLDELPQLFNILKGDISLVGPRPIVESETLVYGRDLQYFLSVKPGLTGYWQAYARNNATYESGERQKMELYYVEHQSFWLDIKIIARTFGAVLKKDGAM